MTRFTLCVFLISHSRYFDLDRESVQNPYLYEYRINVLTNALVSEKYLLDQNGERIAAEFPTIYRELETYPTRFVYLMKLDRKGIARSGGVVKYDRSSGVAISYGNVAPIPSSNTKDFVWLIFFFLDYCSTCFGQETRFVSGNTDTSGPEDFGSLEFFFFFFFFFFFKKKNFLAES